MSARRRPRPTREQVVLTLALMCGGPALIAVAAFVPALADLAGPGGIATFFGLVCVVLMAKGVGAR